MPRADTLRLLAKIERLARRPGTAAEGDAASEAAARLRARLRPKPKWRRFCDGPLGDRRARHDRPVPLRAPFGRAVPAPRGIGRLVCESCRRELAVLAATDLVDPPPPRRRRRS